MVLISITIAALISRTEILVGLPVETQMNTESNFDVSQEWYK